MISVKKERVDLGYLLATLDFAALQTRLALIDTCLNESGLDEGLWTVYNEDSKMSDLHSLTGFSIFVDSVKKKVIEAELPDGKKVTFFPTEKVKVKRDGKDSIVLGSELLETDEWVDFAK